MNYTTLSRSDPLFSSKYPDWKRTRSEQCGVCPWPEWLYSSHVIFSRRMSLVLGLRVSTGDDCVKDRHAGTRSKPSLYIARAANTHTHAYARTQTDAQRPAGQNESLDSRYNHPYSKKPDRRQTRSLLLLPQHVCIVTRSCVYVCVCVCVRVCVSPV